MRNVIVIVTATILAVPAFAQAWTKQELALMAVARAAVTRQLKDPSSARFEAVGVMDKGRYVCGFVNAKNSYGGYTGSQMWALEVATGRITFESDVTTADTSYERQAAMDRFAHCKI